MRQFYTIYEQKFSNLRPPLFITFPQRFQKSKKFEHWTSGSGGKKTFKCSKQMKRIFFYKNFFLPLQFYTLYEQKFPNLRPLICITFPLGLKKKKNVSTLDLGKWGQKDRYKE